MSGKVPAPRIYLSHRTHPFGTAGYDAITVLATALGSGRGSRLYQRLADGSRIAQPDYVGAYGVDLAHAPAPLIVTATAKDGVDVETLEAGLTEVLDSFATEPVTADELERAKALLTTSWWRQMSTVGGRADTLGRYATQFGDPGSAAYRLPAWQSVTAGDITDAALTLKPESRVTLTYVPADLEERGVTLIATRPDSGVARPYSFPDVVRTTVGGGLVVAAHMPGQLLATASLLLDAGAAREADGREGTATILAKSLEEGTRSLDSAGFALALERLGAELSTSVDWDSFRVGVSVPVDLLPARRGPAGGRRPHPEAGSGGRRPGPRRRGDRAADGLGAARTAGGRGPARRPVRRHRAVRPPAARRPGVGGRGDRGRRAGVPRRLAAAGRRTAGGRRPGPAGPGRPGRGRVRRHRGRAAAPPRARWACRSPPSRRTILVDRPGSVQSTLRLGHRAPERAHPDYVTDVAGRDGPGRRVHVPAQPPDPRGEGLHLRHPRRLRDEPPLRPVRGERRRCRPR